MTPNPFSREVALHIYQDNKELIDNDAQFGEPWNMRVARTIKQLAGVSA